MANVYVDSTAAGAGTGADWANAYLTLAAALTAKAAGDIFYVAHDHAETQASSMTLTSPGTAAAPCQIICVSSAGTVPPVSADLATTATISTTGSGSNITTAGVVSRCYGITFNVGDSTNAASFVGGGAWRYHSCNFRNLGNSSSGTIRPQTTFLKTVWENCTAQFAHIGQSFTAMVGGTFEWKNTATAISGATIPTNLFVSANYGSIYLQGVDLVALNTKTVMGTPAGSIRFHMEDCKIHSATTFSGTPTVTAARLTASRCDDGAGNHINEVHDYLGDLTTETTIVRTGGATDGTTPIAWKIITTARPSWADPFESQPIYIWNESTSSITVTIEGIWGGGAVPLNDEIWIEVRYLGDAASPQGSFAHTTKADSLATGANTTASAESWGGSTTAFKMAATFTPAQKGALSIVIKAAKVSTTFYVDPEPAISGVTVSKSHLVGRGYVNELSSGSATGAKFLG
jgi:hypothetical protein